MKGFGYEDKLNKIKKVNINKQQLINNAVNLHTKGDIKKALDLYRKFIDMGYKDPTVLSNYGLILYEQKKLDKAKKLFEESIDLFPNSPQAYSNLGNLYKEEGELKQSVFYQTKAIEIDPKFINAYFNLGNLMRDLNNLQKAQEFYKKVIELNPNLAVGYTNLGITLSDLNLFDEAEKNLLKAINLNPSQYQAHYNLGNLYRTKGHLKLSENYYKKAISSNRYFASSYFNLVIVLQEQNKLDEAEKIAKLYLENDQSSSKAYINLGNILKDKGKYNEALMNYKKAYELSSENTDYLNYAILLIENVNPKVFETKILKEIINIILNQKDIRHGEIFKAFNSIYEKKRLNILLSKDLEELHCGAKKIIQEDELFINALNNIVFQNPSWEEFIKNIRFNFLEIIYKNKKISNYSEILKITIAIASQCFLNEYIYSLKSQEKLMINKLINKSKNKNLNKLEIAILACYEPLYKNFKSLSYFKNDSNNNCFNSLIKVQLAEPLKELEISKKIRKIGSIKNAVSEKVKNQYEQNPYPRWKGGNPYSKTKIPYYSVINSVISPNIIENPRNNGAVKILIAGCGTGNQIINAQKYKDAEITAIDLSYASLSFAKRKLDELKITNVNLYQMDIYDVELLKINFDIIECSGVLHHMSEPSRGIDCLIKVLKKGGYIKIGLYSELAREDVILARKLIAHQKYNYDIKGIREFRMDVLSNKFPEINSLKKTADFFTSSMCRDLCFHVQEHRFNINQIDNILNSHNLEFLGFFLPKNIKSFYAQDYPNDKKQTNLDNWAEFEIRYKSTFRKMYQFWSKKL